MSIPSSFVHLLNEFVSTLIYSGKSSKDVNYNLPDLDITIPVAGNTLTVKSVDTTPDDITVNFEFGSNNATGVSTPKHKQAVSFLNRRKPIMVNDVAFGSVTSQVFSYNIDGLDMRCNGTIWNNSDTLRGVFFEIPDSSIDWECVVKFNIGNNVVTDNCSNITVRDSMAANGRHVTTLCANWDNSLRRSIKRDAISGVSTGLANNFLSPSPNKYAVITKIGNVLTYKERNRDDPTEPLITLYSYALGWEPLAIGLCASEFLNMKYISLKFEEL